MRTYVRMYLKLQCGVTIQVGCVPSLTGFVRQWVQKPQRHGPWPVGPEVADGVEEGHVGATYRRVTDASVEGHLGHKHRVRRYLHKMVTFNSNMRS